MSWGFHMKGKLMFPLADLHALTRSPRHPAGLSPLDAHARSAREILARERAERRSAARARRRALMARCKAVMERVLNPLNSGS